MEKLNWLPEFQPHLPALLGSSGECGVAAAGQKDHMDTSTYDAIRTVWEDRVRGKPIYHGMSSVNLTDPLDPANDPFAAMRPKLYRLLDVLQRLTDGGFQFIVREEHFGVKYANDLRLIVAWSRNDLDNPGIDFTTSYYDACGCSDSCQGSQLQGELPVHHGPLVRAR